MKSLVILALVLAKAAPAQTFWWDTPPATLCRAADASELFNKSASIVVKRDNLARSITRQLKSLRCASSAVEARTWKEQCISLAVARKKKVDCIGENAKCPSLRASMPPKGTTLDDLLTELDHNMLYINACIAEVTKDQAKAKADYEASHQAAPAPDPAALQKLCAKLKKSRDEAAGLATLCVANPVSCFVDATTVAGLQKSMDNLGCK